MRASHFLSLAIEARHLTRRTTLLSIGHKWQSWKATSVAQTTLIDGIQTTELLTLSPSQLSETTISSPSRNRRGSLSGVGMVGVRGISSGPKRSIRSEEHTSELQSR